MYIGLAMTLLKRVLGLIGLIGLIWKKMNIFRKHQNIWKVIVIISSISLVAMSFAPLLYLR